MDYHCYQLLGACVCFIEACSSSSAFTWLVSCIGATLLLLQFFLTNNKNHRSKLLLLLLNLLLLQLEWFFILGIVVIMKRLESSDSLGALISLCPSAEEKGSGGGGSYRSFQSILDGFEDEDCGEESGCQITEKKRRLSVDQVKALEKNFEVENKLEPERKVKLAQELGLQPRQVAVWFQNRRARWKTKQLEKDYGMLKSNYEALKSNFEALQHENEALAMEVSELKEKLELTGNVESHVKEEERFSVKREDVEEEEEMLVINNNYNGNDKNKQQQQQQGYGVISMFSNDLKDGSDSDSSAILNDDNSSRSSGGIFSLPLASASAAASSSLRFNTCSSPGLQISESRVSLSAVAHKAYHQFFKMEEEHNDHLLNTDDESCNFFADDQAPTLQWYCGGDPWT